MYFGLPTQLLEVGNIRAQQVGSSLPLLVVSMDVLTIPQRHQEDFKDVANRRLYALRMQSATPPQLNAEINASL